MAIRLGWNSLSTTNFHSSLKTQAQSTSRRSLFYWLSVIFNSVDQTRIEEVGPDRACAEWLLKNGAAVKWKEDGTIVSDYNVLPPLEAPRKHIQAVDASNSAISHVGFPHFMRIWGNTRGRGNHKDNACVNRSCLTSMIYTACIVFPDILMNCNYIDEVKLVNCKYIENPALPLLSVLKDTLKHLEISRCWSLSGKALLDLDKLTNLKTLKLENMSHIDNKSEVIEKLTKALPNCNINFK